MSSEMQQIITVIACFVLGGMAGHRLGMSSREQEVREWKAIARRAQRLNSLANSLEQERANGYSESSD